MLESDQCLIVSTGRSGTLFVTKVLKALGVSAAHEREDGLYVASFYHARKYQMFKWVLHQVRHPLKVVGSLVTFDESAFRASENLLKPLYGVVYPKPMGFNKSHREGKYSAAQWEEMVRFRKVGAVWHAYYWNRMIEEYLNPLFRYKVEELRDSVDRILSVTGSTMTPGVDVGAVFESLGTKTHTRPNRLDMTWDEVEEISPKVAPLLREMTDRYGYEL